MIIQKLIKLLQDNQVLKENYDNIYNEVSEKFIGCVLGKDSEYNIVYHLNNRLAQLYAEGKLHHKLYSQAVTYYDGRNISLSIYIDKDSGHHKGFYQEINRLYQYIRGNKKLSHYLDEVDIIKKFFNRDKIGMEVFNE